MKGMKIDEGNPNQSSNLLGPRKKDPLTFLQRKMREKLDLARLKIDDTI